MNQQDYQYQQTHTRTSYISDEVVTLKEWLLSMLLLLIPFANIILPFYWAFASGVKKSKQNFFRAQLIFRAISLGLVILSWSLIIGLLAALGLGLSY